MPRISGPEWYQLLKQCEKEYEGKGFASVYIISWVTTNSNHNLMLKT